MYLSELASIGMGLIASQSYKLFLPIYVPKRNRTIMFFFCYQKVRWGSAALMNVHQPTYILAYNNTKKNTRLLVWVLELLIRWHVGFIWHDKAHFELRNIHGELYLKKKHTKQLWYTCGGKGQYTHIQCKFFTLPLI